MVFEAANLPASPADLFACQSEVGLGACLLLCLLMVI